MLLRISGVPLTFQTCRSGRQKVPSMSYATIRSRFAPDATPHLRVRRADSETTVIDVASRSALIRVA